jgi:hypothetical protein
MNDLSQAFHYHEKKAETIIMSSEREFDSSTVEVIRTCKREQFPACLERALTRIFLNKEPIFSIAKKAGFETKELINHKDVMQAYLDFILTLEGTLGSDAVAVVESIVIQEIEALKCIQCPIYKMELERKRTKFAAKFPASSVEL